MAPPVPPTPPSRGRPKLSQHRKTKIAIAFVCTFFVAMLTMFPYFAYWLLLKPRAHVTIGAVDRATPAVEQYFAANATLELLHDDFVWAEGPLYVRPDPAQPKADYVLASDVRSNQMLKWQGRISLAMYPSGYEGPTEDLKEPGSNGLALLPGTDLLVMCQHGNRQVVRVEADKTHTVLASHYRGKRLNSPNDLAFAPDGALYFTDPSYGLDAQEDDPARELNFNGIYRLPPAALRRELRPDERAQLLQRVDDGDMKRPNGLAFTPDGAHLIVSDSHAQRRHWKIFDVAEDGSLVNGRVFAEVPPHLVSAPGNPDGLKIDARGTVFASGPGGVLLFDATGRYLGGLQLGRRTSNVALGQDGALYVTADTGLGRVPLRQRE